MKLKFRIMFFCMSLLFFFHPTLAFTESKLKVGDKVPNFLLEGTDDRQYELEKMQGKVVVLFMGSPKKGEEPPGRGLSEQHNAPPPPREPWLPELYNVFQEEAKANGNLYIFEVAGMEDTALMPKTAVKVMVKKFMKDEKFSFTRILLFDWGQEVSKLLGTAEGKVNIFVINKKRFLVHYQAVTYSRENFSVLKSVIDKNLKSE